MNWEAIGAVGEVGGALGVVVTLVYLAVQVRQNSEHLRHSNESVRAATELESGRLAAEWNLEVAANAELAELWDASTRNEMTPLQHIRFRFMIASLFYRFEGLYRQRERKLLSDESWLAWEKVIQNTLALPEVRAWLAEENHPFSQSFQKVVGRLAAERDANSGDHNS